MKNIPNAPTRTARQSGAPLPAAALLAAMILLPAAHAAVVRVWDGEAGDNNLLTATNWSLDTAPVTGNGLQFTNVAPSGTALTLASALNLGSTFGSPQAPAIEFVSGAAAFTFSGAGQITIATGGIRNSSGTTQTFDNQVRLNTGSVHQFNNANSALVFGGEVVFQAGTSNFAMGNATGHSVTFSGNLIQPAAPATQNLSFNNATNAAVATLNGTTNAGLTGNLSIGGNVRVNIGSATGLSAATTVTMNGAGATLANTSGSALSTAASLALNAASQAYTFGASGHTAANSMAFNGTAAINADQTRTLNLTGTGLTVTSGSVWNNTVTGNRALTVNGAGNTLALAGIAIGATGETANVTFTYSGAANLTLSGGVTNGLGTGTRGLQHNGAGTFTINGASNYSGSTGVGSNATLLVNGTHTGGGNYSVAGILGGTGTIDLSASNATVNFFSGGTGRLQVSSTDTLTIIGGSNAALNLTNAVTPNTSPTLLFTLGAPGTTVVDVQGLLNIGSGTLNFDDFSFATTTGFGAGVYNLFGYTSVTGTLGSSLTGTIGGLGATISNDSLNNAIIVTVIPEPSAFAALAGLAGLGLVGLRRRRRD